MPDLKAIKILNHKQTPTGSFLQMLFEEGHSAWLALHIAMEVAPDLTLHYLYVYIRFMGLVDVD